MSTKAPNPQCKINFGNLTFQILILQTTWFRVFLRDFGTKSRFSFGILILQTTWFTAYLHDLGTKCRFSFRILILHKKRMRQMSTKASNPQCKINFGNLTFRILILQTTWFWFFCMIFGTKSRFSLKTLSSKPPGLQRLCMILGLNPDSVVGSLSSKPAGLQRICMILGLNLDSICGSWSCPKKKDENNVYKSLESTMQN